MKNTQSKEPALLTRRDVMLIGSAAVAGGFLLGGCEAEAAQSAPTDPPRKWCDKYPNSVFCQTYGTFDPHKDNYDKDGAYALYAIWMMLTTEEWACNDSNSFQRSLKNREWLRLTAGDMGVMPHNLEYLYGKASKLQGLRQLWQQKFRPKLGRGFYPGGGVLLKLGRIFNYDNTINDSPWMIEKCGDSTPANTHESLWWPVSLWLMLTTDHRWLQKCFSSSGFAGKLWIEFGIGAGDIANANALVQLAHDNPQPFDDAEGMWSDLLTVAGTSVYGGRPCPGSPTLVEIANGGVRK